MTGSRWRERVAAVLLLAFAWMTGCSNGTTDPDGDCGKLGDVCSGESSCCDALTCSNGICQPPGGDGTDEPSPLALADFSAVDVNPQSARYQQSVSPRDYLGQVSAWYFGHST